MKVAWLIILAGGMAMGRIINIGLIGFGLSGRVFHAPIILSTQGFRISKVYETKDENLKKLKELCPEAQAVSNTEDIFQDDSIELVVITAPNALHFPLCKRALECNKNVVVEKPFTISTRDADRLIALAGDKEKLLSVYQNRRWDGDYMTIRKLVEEKALGRLVEYQAAWGRFRPQIKDTWKEKEGSGCGILYDLGSHLIDQAICLFGLPHRIFADLRQQRDGSTANDYFQIILEYEDLRAELKGSMLMKDAGPRYSLYGTEGCFKKFGIDPQEENLKAGKLPKDCGQWGQDSQELWGTLLTDKDGTETEERIPTLDGDYRQFYTKLYDALCNKGKNPVNPKEARNVIRIIELAEESASQGAWVRYQA